MQITNLIITFILGDGAVQSAMRTAIRQSGGLKLLSKVCGGAAVANGIWIFDELELVFNNLQNSHRTFTYQVGIS